MKPSVIRLSTILVRIMYAVRERSLYHGIVLVSVDASAGSSYLPDLHCHLKRTAFLYANEPVRPAFGFQAQTLE